MPSKFHPNTDAYIIQTLPKIGKFCGVSAQTITSWIKKDGFPAIIGKNGTYQTTPGLIDLWLLAQWEEQNIDDPEKIKARQYVPFRYSRKGRFTETAQEEPSDD